ncbi:MAG: hypothetical protein ACE5EK_11595, partial [Nitrospinales bacterium]
MPKHWLYFLILGIFFISSPINGAYAHSGHKKKAVEMKEPAPVESSIYAVGEDDNETPSAEADIFPLSRADSLSDEIPLTPETMEQMDHKMPEIEIAKREWVSPKKKVY